MALAPSHSFCVPHTRSGADRERRLALFSFVMSFTEDSFMGKLIKLSDSQQSIQTLSHWVQYHKKAAKDSARVWAEQAAKAPPARQLLFVYLANDIMQNSKRKGEEFIEAYWPQVASVFPRIFSLASASVQAKYLRIVAIWEERGIVSSARLAPLRAQLSGAAPPTAGSAPAPPPAKPPAKPSARSHAAAVGDDDDDEYVPAPKMARTLERSPSLASASGAAAAALPLRELLLSFDQVRRTPPAHPPSAATSSPSYPPYDRTSCPPHQAAPTLRHYSRSYVGDMRASRVRVRVAARACGGACVRWRMQGSLIDELQAEREADLDMSPLEQIEPGIRRPSARERAGAEREGGERGKEGERGRGEGERGKRRGQAK